MSESKSKKTTQQKAAEARAAQLAAEKRRERTIRIVGAIVVLIVVAGIIGGAVIFSKKDNGGPGPDPSAALPTGVSGGSYGYPVNPVKTGVPDVQLWEDFQCPACKTFETNGMGAALVGAAKTGKLNLLWRPTTFLDANLPQSDDSSARATSAWGCAINAGKAVEYHDAVYAAQPPTEGTGYTQQTLLDLGAKVGISGGALEEFNTCVNEEKYLGWAANSTKAFTDAGVPGTPAVYVNGKELSMQGITSPQQLVEKVLAAGAPS